jgi:hypothetical protein
MRIIQVLRKRPDILTAYIMIHLAITVMCFALLSPQVTLMDYLYAVGVDLAFILGIPLVMWGLNP